MFSTEILLSLLTLSVLEVVLGIDNIIFISILAGRLPPEHREKARKIGLLGAFISRLVFLSFASFIVTLTRPLFTAFGVDFSGKSLILFAGGLFLLYKATAEIHNKLEGADEHGQGAGAAAVTLGSVLAQVILLDTVFSIDSVITAVGMTNVLWVMVAANVIALAVMLGASASIAKFVERHPTVKVLALSFLLMIGLVLIAEAFGAHIPKGYIYFAMGFSVGVELLNIRMKRSGKPVELHNIPRTADAPGEL